MAGMGPPPKDPAKRARRNAAPSNRLVSISPEPQPSLEELFGDMNPATDEAWHSATLRFWDELGRFPTTQMMVGAQWSMLGVAVILFDRVMRGKLGYAEEMRREIAAYGITPADLARLRITFAVADEAEARGNERAEAKRVTRYAALRAVDSDDSISA